MRRPCIISPYHLRLDWLMWFAAMGHPADYPWVYHLVWKLLHNDPLTLGLLAGNPFPGEPPRYIRAELYRYRFAPPGDPAWWIRTPLRPWLPAVSANDEAFISVLKDYGWVK
jgi:hypothetical protein